MQQIPTTPTVLCRKTQESLIETRGDEIWETICDTVALDRPFRARDLVDTIPCISHHAETTQVRYISAVLKNVIEQWKYLPSEEGSPPLKYYYPSRRGWYVLPSLED